MSLAIKRIKVYIRVLIVAVLVVTIGLVLFKNRDNSVGFWFFGLTDESKPVNVVWLLVWTASATLLVARIFWYLRGVWSDLHELKQADVERAAIEAREKRATELEERERRLTEKLDAAEARDAAGSENSNDGD